MPEKVKIVKITNFNVLQNCNYYTDPKLYFSCFPIEKYLHHAHIELLYKLLYFVLLHLVASKTIK